MSSPGEPLTADLQGVPPDTSQGQTQPPSLLHVIEKLKDDGNVAFTRAKLLRKTTAAKQYLNDAKQCYAEAISKSGSAEANEETLSLVCTLHSNLAAVFLLEVPPKWPEAKAAAEIALTVNPKHVKALYRRGQGSLEDGREGLPEASLRGALYDFEAALAEEPANKQIRQEADRIRKRVRKMEAARRVPNPADISCKVPSTLLDRGGDCLHPQGYVWGQTASVVHIFVPARGVRFTRSSASKSSVDPSVEIKSRSLRICIPAMGEGTDGLEFRIDGKLSKAVRPDDSSWQVENDGLLVHIELAKLVLGDEEQEGLDGDHSEHWRCAWEGHPETRAPSAKEREKIHSMAQTANRMPSPAASNSGLPEGDAKAAEALRRMRDMCPGVQVEWGDTSLESLQ